MKKTFVVLAVLIVQALTIRGSEPSAAFSRDGLMYRNLFAEVFGTSGVAGVNYEQRFRPGSKFGWRVGIAYNYRSDQIGSDGNDTESNGVMIPVGVNGLFGSRNSKFEAGINLNFGIYHASHLAETKNVFNGGVSVNIGYRYQRPSGFMFRVGFGPEIAYYGKFGGYSWYSLFPYLGFGYTFK